MSSWLFSGGGGEGGGGADLGGGREGQPAPMEGLVLRSLQKIRKQVSSSSRRHKALRDSCDAVIGKCCCSSRGVHPAGHAGLGGTWKVARKSSMVETTRWLKPHQQLCASVPPCQRL